MPAKKMDWTIVNWFPTERTMDITHLDSNYNKVRWYVWIPRVLPLVFTIVNQLLKG